MKHQTIIGITALMISSLFNANPVQAGSFPECGDPGVLHKVGHTLKIAERNVVQSGDPVTEITRPHQHKLRVDGPRRMDQRYCHATGHTESGRKKRIYYLVEAGAGFAGWNYGVEACILGRDPWKIHGAHCRSVR